MALNTIPVIAHDFGWQLEKQQIQQPINDKYNLKIFFYIYI